MKDRILVAEIGINHQGNLELAKEMARVAWHNGADAVKLQIRTPELCVPRAEWNKPKLAPWGENTTYIEYRRGMEFTDEDLREFDRFVKEEIGDPEFYWFPSVFDIDALRRALALGVAAIKLPSAMLTNTNLLEAAIDGANHLGVPLILSTGMSTYKEICKASELLTRQTLAVPPAVLHCNSSYPTADEEVNLWAMSHLEMLFPKDTIVGFSSHSVSPFPAIYSAVLGAKMIEVHFTLDRTMPGSDHAASQEPAGLALIARELKRIDKVIGDGRLTLYDSELPARKKLRGN